MSALLIDNWHSRNQRAIVGGGLASAVRMDLVNELTRTLAPLCRRAARVEDEAAQPAPAATPAKPGPRKLKASDMAKLVPFKGKILLPGEPAPIAHPPAPKAGRKRWTAPVPDAGGQPDAA